MSLKRIVLILTFVFVLLGSSFAFAKHDDRYVEIVNDNVEYRSIPLGKVLGVCYKGETYKYLGTKIDIRGDYWRKILKDDKKVYIPVSYSEIIDNPIKNNSVPLKYRYIRVDSVLSVIKERPDGDIVGTAFRGQKYKCCGSLKDKYGNFWRCILLNNKKRFILLADTSLSNNGIEHTFEEYIAFSPNKAEYLYNEMINISIKNHYDYQIELFDKEGNDFKKAEVLRISNSSILYNIKSSEFKISVKDNNNLIFEKIYHIKLNKRKAKIWGIKDRLYNKEEINFKVASNGFKKPLYRLSYFKDGKSHLISDYSNKKSYSFTPPSNGHYRLNLNVKEKNSQNNLKIEDYFDIYVDDQQDLGLLVYPQKESCVEENIRLKALYNNPFDSYRFSYKYNGEEKVISGFSDIEEVFFKLEEVGKYTFKIEANRAGAISTKTVEFDTKPFTFIKIIDDDLVSKDSPNGNTVSRLYKNQEFKSFGEFEDIYSNKWCGLIDNGKKIYVRKEATKKIENLDNLVFYTTGDQNSKITNNIVLKTMNNKKFRKFRFRYQLYNKTHMISDWTAQNFMEFMPVRSGNYKFILDAWDGNDTVQKIVNLNIKDLPYIEIHKISLNLQDHPNGVKIGEVYKGQKFKTFGTFKDNEGVSWRGILFGNRKAFVLSKYTASTPNGTEHTIADKVHFLPSSNHYFYNQVLYIYMKDPGKNKLYFFEKHPEGFKPAEVIRLSKTRFYYKIKSSDLRLVVRDKNNKIICTKKYNFNIKSRNAELRNLDNEIYPNGNINFQVSSSGFNTPLYEVLYIKNGLARYISKYSQKTSYSFSPSRSGQYKIVVNVKEKNGNNPIKTYDYKDIYVASNSSLGINSNVGNRSYMNAPIELKALKNKEFRKYQFSYNFNGKNTIISDWSATQKVEFLPKVEGNYIFNLKAWDQNGTETKSIEILAKKLSSEINISYSNTPNTYGTRLNQMPEFVVAHITDGAYGGSVNWLKNPKSQASSNFVVSRTGHSTRLVNIHKAPWTNGTSYFKDRNVSYIHSKVDDIVKRQSNANLYSVTIEHAGLYSQTHGTLTSIQKSHVVAIIKYTLNELSRVYNNTIPFDRYHFIGHYQVNPKTKGNCPGQYYPFNEIIQRVNKE